MKFHGIEMQGPLLIEEVTSLPVANTETRFVYYDGNVYYNTGSAWKSILTSDTTTFLVATNNLSDLTNVSTALSNLGIDDAFITWSTKTTSFNAVKSNGYILNTGITATLPSSPTVGDYIAFAPGADLSSTSSYVNPNGKKIMGETGNLEIDVALPFALVYKNVTWGWALA